MDKYQHPNNGVLTETISRKPIVEVAYDKDHILTYEEVLSELYKTVIFKFMHTPVCTNTLKAFEYDICDILKKVINNDIRNLIHVEVLSITCGGRNTIDIKYLDIETRKEVTIHELYKYTYNNLIMIKNGFKPVNNAMKK